MDSVLAPLHRLLDEVREAAAEPASSRPSATERAPPTNVPTTSVTVARDCGTDLRAFCGPEADVLALLREVADGVAPAKLDAAERNERLCLARHADALAPRCVEALVTDAMVRRGADVAASAPPPLLTGRGVDPDEDSSVEINIYYSRRHHGAAGHAFRAGGGALSASHLSASDVGHSVLWALALPFCLLGLYVAAKQGVTYVRRRREERRIECKQQYLPVH